MQRPANLTQYETAMHQNRKEFGSFIELIQAEKVGSYLEIGSRFGGTLWGVANALPKAARIVSVDMPTGNYAKEHEACLRHAVERLRTCGYDAHLIFGDSTKKFVVSAAHALGPFDMVFIDANHLLPYVTADWKNYGPLGRLVAFHDISWKRRPEKPNAIPIEVPGFWDKLKADYRHVEFKHEERDNGIGVLWRSS